MSDDKTNLLAPIDYDADNKEPVEIPVTYKGRKYVLKEADGSVSFAYRSAAGKGVRLVDEKVQADSITGTIEAEFTLVGGCLYHTEGEMKDKAVGTLFAKSLPNRLLKELYERAKVISGLDNKPMTEDDHIKAVTDAQKSLDKFRAAKAKGQGDDPKALRSDSQTGST